MRNVLFVFLFFVLFVCCDQSSTDESKNKNDKNNSEKESIAKQNARTLVSEAKALFIMKNYYDAQSKLQSALNQDPTNSDAYYLLGRYHEINNNDKQAIKNYLRAEELGNEDVLARLSVYYFFEGNFSKSKESLDEAEKKQKQEINTKMHLLKAIFIALTGNAEEAKKYLKSLELDIDTLSENWETSLLNNYLQGILNKTEKSEEAIADFESIQQSSYPNLAAKATIEIADIYLKQKNFDKALNTLQYYFDSSQNKDVLVAIITILLQLEKRDDIAKYLNILLEMDSVYHIEKTMVLLTQYRYLDQLLVTAQKHLENHPKSEISLLVIAQVYTQKKIYPLAKQKFHKLMEMTERKDIKAYILTVLSGLDISEGKTEEAIQKLEEAIKYDEKSLTSHLFLAKIYIAKKQTEKAIVIYEKLIKVFPKELKFKIELIRTYMFLENWKKAQEKAQNILKESPNSMELKTILATTHYMLGEQDKAQQIYNDVIKNAPKQEAAIAANNLANIFADLGVQLDYAQELAELAVKNTGHPSAMDTLAWVLYKKKNYEDAKKILDKIITVRANSPYVNYHYAKVLLTTSDRKDAISYFEKALELSKEDFPHYLDCQQQLKMLKNK